MWLLPLRGNHSSTAKINRGKHVSQQHSRGAAGEHASAGPAQGHVACGGRGGNPARGKGTHLQHDSNAQQQCTAACSAKNIQVCDVNDLSVAVITPCCFATGLKLSYTYITFCSADQASTRMHSLLDIHSMHSAA